MDFEPVVLEFDMLPADHLKQIVGWLADGTVGANLRFSVGQEGSDFDMARNVIVYIENPTVITASQLQRLIELNLNLVTL